MWVNHHRGKSLIAGICALAIAGASVPASAMPLGGQPATTAGEAVGPGHLVKVDHRGKRHKRKYRKRPYAYHKYDRYPRHRRYYRRHNDGLGIILGLTGLGIGLAIANNHNQAYYPHEHRAYCPVPGTDAWHLHCLRKYKSYVPATGMYTRYSGQKAYCVCP